MSLPILCLYHEYRPLYSCTNTYTSMGTTLKFESIIDLIISLILLITHIKKKHTLHALTMKSLRRVRAFSSVLARMARLKDWSLTSNTHCRSSGERLFAGGRRESLL